MKREGRAPAHYDRDPRYDRGSDRCVEYYESGAYADLNARQRDLATVALNQPGVLFTAAEVRDRMKVSENTARDDLKKLTALGLMKSMKEGKGNVYLSPKSLHELKKWSNRLAEPRSAQDW